MKALLILFVFTTSTFAFGHDSDDMYSGSASPEEEMEAESQIQATEGDMGEESIEKQKQEDVLKMNTEDNQDNEADSDLLGDENIEGDI